MLAEPAPAKVNLVLQVGRPRADGLHPLCSLFATLELEDEVRGEPAAGQGGDVVECPGVPGPNLASAAIQFFRESAGGRLPPLRLEIRKRIPVAAGLGGGSADAAAALRIANRLSDRRLGDDELRALAARLGSDVPSQVQPAHALVSGVGEVVEPVDLPSLAVVLVPAKAGLSAAAVYAELDRLGGWRKALDPGELRRLAGLPGTGLAAALQNDLEPAVLSLRPELEATLGELRARGAPAAAVSGSGPTCFALFETRDEADEAARSLPGAIVTATRAER